jgi:hypothetical protein
MLRRLPLMDETSVADGLLLDLSPVFDDSWRTTEVDIGRRRVAEVFVVALMVVALGSIDIQGSTDAVMCDSWASRLIDLEAHEWPSVMN